MKKNVVILLALFMSIPVFSQQQQQQSRSFLRRQQPPVEVFTPVNELKLNLPLTIFGSYPEISYERVFKEDLSFGFSAGVGLSDRYTLNYNLTPYFRWFFGGNSRSMEKVGAGLFLEANGSLFGMERYYDIWTWRTENVFGAGIGMAIGWKYVSQNDWVMEYVIGIGRDLVNDGTYPRMGISIGRRF